MPTRSPTLMLALAAGLLAGPARADGTLSTGRDVAEDCGGDAFSSAELVRRPARRGPITAVPQTLCADLAPGRPREVEIDAYPVIVPGDGGGRPGAPYGRRPRW